MALVLIGLLGMDRSRDEEDTILSWGTNLGQELHIDRVKWEFVNNHLQGVLGRDPAGHFIRYYPQGTVFPLYAPFSGEKQSLCGRLFNYYFYDAWGDEADWCNQLVPSEPFADLVELGFLYADDADEIIECDGEPCMEAEITPDEHYYGNPFFVHPGGCESHDGHCEEADDDFDFEGTNICLYGPWVGDYGHGGRPEIHPSELIWL